MKCFFGHKWDYRVRGLRFCKRCKTSEYQTVNGQWAHPAEGQKSAERIGNAITRWFFG